MPADIVRDPTSLPYRLVRGGARVLLRAYYPDLVIEGAERVPDGPLLVCANHPNSLIDPVLVSVFLPRKIHWLAKHVLFAGRVLGPTLKAAGAIPVKRRHEGGDKQSTDETLRAAADALVGGRAIGIFPEGKTHDDDRLAPLKSGAGRMAVLAARDLAATGSGRALHVLPVVLHFVNKMMFRTGALVTIGEPFVVGPEDQPEAVMQRLREGMTSLMVHVDDAAQEALLRDARVLLRRRAALDPAHSDPKELHALDAAVARAIRRFSVEEPERIAAFSHRLRAYVNALDRQGLSLHSLEESHERPQRTWLAMGLLPLALWGALHSGLPYRLTKRWGLASAGRSRSAPPPAGGPDPTQEKRRPPLLHRPMLADRTTVALYSLLVGAIVFPLTWLAESALIFHFLGWMAALIFLVTAPITGLIARWTFHVLRRQSGRLADAILIGAHRHAITRLKAERAWLWSEIERWQGMLGR